MANKRANLAYNWVEYVFLLLLIIGFILALNVGSAVMAYGIIFICGFISGRLVYKLKRNITLPFYIIILGFLLGYVLGSYYGNKKLIVAFFLVANIVSFFLYDKEYLT